MAAKSALTRQPVELNGEQALAVAQGFAKSIEEDELTCWACAILPSHCHLVLSRHRQSVEWMIMRLKRAGTRMLLGRNLHPFQHLIPADSTVPPAVWARGHRQIFLNSAADVIRDIRYVEENPVRDGKRPQRWSFVAPYAK